MTAGQIFTSILLATFFPKVLCATFMYSQFGLVILWQKKIGAIAACKMMVNLNSNPFIASKIFKCFLK